MADSTIPTQQEIADDFYAKADKLFKAAAADDSATGPKPKSDGQPTSAPSSGSGDPDSGRSQPESGSKPVAIPLPPKFAAKEEASRGSPAGSDSAQQGDEFADIPAPDAFDRGAARPQTKDWRRLHELKAKLTEELAAARKEAETLRAATAGVDRQNGVLPQEAQQTIAQLEKERGDLLSRLESVAVERSPRFEAQFNSRVEAATISAKNAVGPQLAPAVEALLKMPESTYRDQQLEQMTEGLTRIQATKLIQSVAALDSINQERAQLASRSGEIFKQWAQEQEETAKAQRTQRVAQAQSAFEAELNGWKDAGLAESDVAIARSVFNGDMDLGQVARASMWVAYGPKAAAQALSLQKENAELKAQLAKYEKAEPGASTYQQPADPAPVTGTGIDGMLEAIQRAGWRPGA